MNAHIRHFAPTDRVSLERAIDAVCAEGRWMSTTCFQPTPSWRHALQEPTCSRHCLLVAEDRDRIVGWCRALPSECKAKVNEAELGIGLLAPYRNQGLGTQLVRCALDWAGEANLPRLRLRTRKSNTRARRVFTRCGFRPLDISGDWIKMVYPVADSAAQGEHL
jgi:RimJ/RimL family protein N-acetyltransferase